MSDEREKLEIPGRRVPDEYFRVKSSARVWNYWLGGKDNYAVDREAGDEYIRLFPEIVETAVQVCQFLIRTVTYLVSEVGLRQFLDIGTGLPTMQNTHEVAQAIAPESKVVYVDNDHCKSGCAHASSRGVWQLGDQPRRGTVTGRPPASESSALPSFWTVAGRWTTEACGPEACGTNDRVRLS
ncbi:MAG TPA: SAM-dependent methyltransferase [Pseudonocardia sp.]|uniref:SAM-dependent methyltransferase n=1 Tax=Pseudonocardia sp. TaxID=60912 RepID=UPI002F3E2F6F